MKFSAHNAQNVIAVMKLLSYCLYYQHDLEIAGAEKDKSPLL